MEESQNKRRLYVGNLNYDMTEQDFRAFFESVGEVEDIKLIPSKYGDRGNGGYGFVTMATDDGADKALALDGSEQMGRSIKIDRARPPKDKTRE